MTVNNPQPHGQQPFDQRQMGQASVETINLLHALRIAWRHFTQQWVPWVVSLLIVAAVVGGMLFFALQKITHEPQHNPSDTALVTVLGIHMVAPFIVTIYILNSYRNACRMTQGKTVTIRDFFRLSGLGNSIVANVFCGIITYIGCLMLIVPGIFAALVLMYVPLAAAINPKATISSAFSEGITAFINNIGQSILIIFLSCVINLAGCLAFGLGVLVTVPLTLITTVVAFLMATRRHLVVPN